MKQKLFFILICLSGISNVDAQPVKAGLYYYGFCDNNSIADGLGTGRTEALSAAIHIPANAYTGKKISTIRIGLNAGCTNVSVWIRSSLAGANLASQAIDNPASQGWTEVTLATPFTIPAGSDIYIGYTATGYYQLGVSGTSAYDGCWIYSNQWENLASYDYGSFCIQAGIDLQGATLSAAKLENLPKSVQAGPNQSMSIQGTIRNYSSVNTANVKVSYQIDNQTPVEQTISTSIPSLQAGNINIPINAIASTGIYNLSVKITEVNGQPNVLADESLNSQIKILSQSFPRKVVLEEGTGTWCGYCPRGAVGMAAMKQKYPDSFIGIAVHDEDPMAVTNYDSYMTANFFTGFPSGVIDRKADLICDPYGSDYYYRSEIAKIPVAGIRLTGGFTDTDKKAITLKTVTTFGVSSGSANFRLAYVLIENGITGYNQQNYFAGGNMGAMGGYENKPAVVTDMVFDDVARGIYSDPTGISGSIPGSITAMTPVEHNYTINLPSSIRNNSQLEVAVLLLNVTTGEIENADKIKITGVYTDIPVISGTQANVYINNHSLYITGEVSETIDIYTVSGVKVYTAAKSSETISVPCSRLPEGIRIVKGSSGWVKKIIY